MGPGAARPSARCGRCPLSWSTNTRGTRSRCGRPEISSQSRHSRQHRADQALGDRLRPRRRDRRAHDLGALDAEDLVECGGELGVVIIDQEAQRGLALTARSGEVTRLRGDPAAARLLGGAGEVDAAALKLTEEEHVDPPQGDGLDGQEVAGEHGRRLTADQLAPGQPTSLSSRAEPGLAQEPSHGPHRYRDPEPGELPGDPLITPARVLARQARYELADLAADARAARSPARVGPAARHELAVPADKRLRRDEERGPAPARQQTAGGGQQRSIGAPKDRTSRLAAHELVAKHHDLELLELLGTTAQQDQLDQPPQGEVKQRREQARP